MPLDPFATARDHIAALNAREVSARDLLEAALKRHKALKGPINAVVVTDINRARKDASAVDAARAKGDTLGALAGLPMTVKECFDMDGLPATAANKQLQKRGSRCGDAAMVSRLRQAGAIIWGKTNVPFMLADSQSFNGIWGTTNNPYDVTKTPGGSSGGAAAALASGLTSLEIGSDIGGSLRAPAHYCGVASIKPTWGALDQSGHVPPLPGGGIDTDLNVVGPMARNIADLQLLWGVLNGDRVATPTNSPVTGVRLALWTDQMGWPLSREVKAAVALAANTMVAEGAIITEARPDIDMDAMADVYLRLLCGVLVKDMPKSFRLLLKMTRPLNAFRMARDTGLFTQSRYATYLMSTPAELATAADLRDRMKDQVRTFFQSHDAILMPVSPTTAFPHMHGADQFSRPYEVDGQRTLYFSWLYWIILASVLHLPAVVVRVGTGKGGLPIGIQIVGAWGAERKLLDIAAMIEARSGGFQAPLLGI